MKEIKFLLQDLLQEAIRRHDIHTNILESFNLIKNEIVGLLKKIQICENINSAGKYFDELQYLQEFLSKLHFKYNFDMPTDLINFIRICDRLDDIRLREYLFDKIKKSEYSFDKLFIK